MQVRAAREDDAPEVREVHLDAFPDDEAQLVAQLAVALLLEGGPHVLSLVAEEKRIMGHVAFSPVTLDGHEEFRGAILAPLAVRQAHQRHGVGSRLVASGLEKLAGRGTEAVFVYGDPDYYGRFGFSAPAAEPYLPPYKLRYPMGWQAIVLGSGEQDLPSGTIRCVPSLCDPALW